MSDNILSALYCEQDRHTREQNMLFPPRRPATPFHQPWARPAAYPSSYSDRCTNAFGIYHAQRAPEGALTKPSLRLLRAEPMSVPASIAALSPEQLQKALVDSLKKLKVRIGGQLNNHHNDHSASFPRPAMGLMPL